MSQAATLDAQAATQTATGRMPRQIPYIIANEGCERFSFYGMKAILTTCLITQFFNHSGDPVLQDVAEAHANSVTHLFVALVYLLSIAGGFMADFVIGR